jgi:hypothetical protein
VYSYNCLNIVVYILCGAEILQYMHATKFTLSKITLDCRSCYDNSPSKLKTITLDLHGFAIELWILVRNVIKTC